MSDTGQEALPTKKSRTAARSSKLGRRPLRAAFLAFCLTVLMATGAGHALALWSQNATVTMQVTAETLPSPELSCAQGSNAQSVVVTWVPQRAGATSYVVTVSRDGNTISTTTYQQPGTTSQTITAPGGINLAYSYTYAVTVTAQYGTWQASPAVQEDIVATKSLLGSPRISCPA